LNQTIKILPENTFFEQIRELAEAGKSIWFDPLSAPFEVARITKNTSAKLIEKPDPVLLAKAIKNDAELAGMREAHKLDAIAMIKFLHWFDQHAPTGMLSEIDIATALESFRREEKTLVDISFDTISGSGPNGAIVHYRVTQSSNRKLVPGELMLVDSGGQYLSGTTDITRTMFTGSATKQQKDRNTRVLKGMIAISTLQFLPKTTGAHIDILARQFLWQVALNYTHGTGHGVGAFLSVHEGPASISPINNIPLQKGMILSNEPGYYLEGEYGIRIENLIHIVDSKISDGWLAFETLTLVPIDTRLIDTSLLTIQETNWINEYHDRVLREVGQHLNAEHLDWLTQATAAI
ncbi:MAG: aminopeptidase P family protein, partial [Devosiaceae bacterium]|nr:aminopeptidase P family protein [Devosiaceae bacterium]